MEGQKALAIDLFCAARGLGCLRIDYSGTGSSAGDFADGTLARWLDEVLAAIDMGAPDGKLMLVGSSMGGWLMLHVALAHPGPAGRRWSASPPRPTSPIGVIRDDDKGCAELRAGPISNSPDPAGAATPKSLTAPSGRAGVGDVPAPDAPIAIDGPCD